MACVRRLDSDIPLLSDSEVWHVRADLMLISPQDNHMRQELYKITSTRESQSSWQHEVVLSSSDGLCWSWGMVTSHRICQEQDGEFE
jgi:hypothetical protein